MKCSIQSTTHKDDTISKMIFSPEKSSSQDGKEMNMIAMKKETSQPP